MNNRKLIITQKLSIRKYLKITRNMGQKFCEKPAEKLSMLSCSCESLL